MGTAWRPDRLWWTAWLAGGTLLAVAIALDYVSQAAGDVLLMLSELSFVAAAALLVRLMRSVTRRQTELVAAPR